MDDNLRAELDNQPWEEIVERLTVFAKRPLWNLSATGQKICPTVGGLEAEDFALQAVKSVLTGERGWDSQKYPNLLVHLTWVVRSQIDNAIKSPYHARREPGDDPIIKADDQDDTFYRGFLEELADVPDLREVAECIFYGIEERADIAEH